jgi:hypothetical protein
MICEGGTSKDEKVIDSMAGFLNIEIGRFLNFVFNQFILLIRFLEHQSYPKIPNKIISFLKTSLYNLLVNI